jgi:hypothetical protein
VELDDTYLRMTNRSVQIAKAAPGSENGWLEGGGMFKRGNTYYYMAGSGCCYCAGGGGAMVFTAPHPLGPWVFQTNVNDALYLPFSPRGAPPPPPPPPSGPVPTSSETCSDLSGEWAMSVLVPNYQPLRAGLTVTKIPPLPPPPPPSPSQVITISTADKRCLQFGKTYGTKRTGDSNLLVTLGPCSPESVVQRWILKSQPSDTDSFRAALIAKSAHVSVQDQHVRLVHEATGKCLDGALGKPGRLLYINECVPAPAVGQTWYFRNASSSTAVTSVVAESLLVNVAATTCVGVSSNSSILMEPCRVGRKARVQQWGVTIVPAGRPTPKEHLTYYNLTSISETHWPAVPSSGWTLQVDEVRKTVAISQSTKPASGSLKPWLNPWANGQKLPAVPDCTMVSTAGGGLEGATLCKLPYCGATRNLPCCVSTRFHQLKPLV